MKSVNWLLAIACITLVGCASGPTKPPSVDVTGTWAGELAGGAFGTTPVTMTLQQSGADVTGDVVIRGGPQFSGPARGSVSGDVLSISYPGSSAELTIKGNEMSGVSRVGNRWTLRRQ
jgi:hypothetical protein